jgi:hypothetical protein
MKRGKTLMIIGIYKTSTNISKKVNTKMRLEYDKLYIDYDKSAKSNLAKDDTIKQLKNEMDDMRNVIGKLTEVRVILNKYFSVNFENFTYYLFTIVLKKEG